jgi:hypothetical protein
MRQIGVFARQNIVAVLGAGMDNEIYFALAPRIYKILVAPRTSN